MFEVKINSIVQSKGKPEIDKMFLEDARGIQICNVIDSLTEEEFLSLQKSILISFDAVQVLNDVVREGIRTKKSYNDIYSELNDAYLESLESSFYFKNKYIQLCNFLVTIHDMLDTDFSEKGKLADKFSESIEKPFDLEKNSILQALFTRNELKNRIFQNGNIKSENIITSQELRNIDSVSQLYEQIREMLLRQVQNEQVKEQIRNAFPSFIDTALVQPMIALRSHLGMKEEEKDNIASILEQSKQEYDELFSNTSKIVTSICILEGEMHSLSEQKEALNQLLETLTAIPGDDFQWEIYFLNQVRESSTRKQRKFYSGKKFRSPSMEDETHCDEKTVSELTSDVLDKFEIYDKQCKKNINKKTVDSINSAFQKMISELSRGHDCIKLYDEYNDLPELPIEAVIKNIMSLKEYLALKEKFAQFFERLLNGKFDKRIVDYFAKKEDKIDLNKKNYMYPIAKFIWNTPMLNTSVVDVDERQLDLYDELRGVRKVQEDEIIDTIIRGSVYQKK